MDVGPAELLWVIIVLAVLFGASRLPAMGRNLGLGIKEFKRGLSEAAGDDRDASEPGGAGGVRSVTLRPRPRLAWVLTSTPKPSPPSIRIGLDPP